MLTVGSKIKMIKAIKGFEKLVDEVFTITCIDEDGTMVIKCKYGMGVMNYKEFEECFIETIEYKWMTIDDLFEHYCYEDNKLKKLINGLTYGLDIRIKSDNNSFIYMKVQDSTLYSEAILHPNDKFDIEVGLKICAYRLVSQMCEARLKRLTK